MLIFVRFWLIMYPTMSAYILDDLKPDVKENDILKLDNELLSILLTDRSSGANIIWATGDYAETRGAEYAFDAPITVASITGKNGGIIKPRTEKSKKEQEKRIRAKAEVFTPSWICNKQNNLIDAAWFGYENAFNFEDEKGWTVNPQKVEFPAGKTWQEYVKAQRLEITCGEAPYLASRYDTVDGRIIPVEERIGLLDRKLRIVCENVDSEPEWNKWATEAVKSVYGYDWQGDNVLLARENLLATFVDFYEYKFAVAPIKEYLRDIAVVLSWNIWQMDGLKFVIPNSCKPKAKAQISFFDLEQDDQPCEGCQKNDFYKHTGIYCKIMNWATGEAELFLDQMRGKRR